MCVLPVIYVQGDWKYKFSTGMDVKSYSDIQCVVLVFPACLAFTNGVERPEMCGLGTKALNLSHPPDK